MIHPTAIICKSAEIDTSVVIGPYSVIGENVNIAANTILESHVVVKKNTTIGINNKIYQFASIGEDPQDLKFNDVNSKLLIFSIFLILYLKFLSLINCSIFSSLFSFAL